MRMAWVAAGGTALAMFGAGCATKEPAAPKAPETAALASKAQTTCPVMGGEISREIYADHEGKRVYFCCPACIAEFKKDPQKYLKKLEAEGVEVEKSPEGAGAPEAEGDPSGHEAM